MIDNIVQFLGWIAFGFACLLLLLIALLILHSILQWFVVTHSPRIERLEERLVRVERQIVTQKMTEPTIAEQVSGDRSGEMNTHRGGLDHHIRQVANAALSIKYGLPEGTDQAFVLPPTFSKEREDLVGRIRHIVDEVLVATS